MAGRRGGGGEGRHITSGHRSATFVRAIVRDFKFELAIIFAEIIRGSYKAFPIVGNSSTSGTSNNVNIETSLLVIKHSRAGRILFSGNGGETGGRRGIN